MAKAPQGVYIPVDMLVLVVQLNLCVAVGADTEFSVCPHFQSGAACRTLQCDFLNRHFSSCP